MIFVIICISVVVALIVINFLEWFVHGPLMHGKRELLEHRSHHEEYPPQNYQNSEHGPHVHLPWWVGAIIAGVMTLLGSFINYLTGLWVITWCFAGTSIFGFWAYNYVHTCYHVPAGRWFETTRWYCFMNRYHFKHHARGYVSGKFTNICVLFPLADWVMGRLLRPKKFKL